jgi:hypothetical protein
LEFTLPEAILLHRPLRCLLDSHVRDVNSNVLAISVESEFIRRIASGDVRRQDDYAVESA